jgi:hypothetical protein
VCPDPRYYIRFLFACEERRTTGDIFLDLSVCCPDIPSSTYKRFPAHSGQHSGTWGGSTQKKNTIAEFASFSPDIESLVGEGEDFQGDSPSTNMGQPIVLRLAV